MNCSPFFFQAMQNKGLYILVKGSEEMAQWLKKKKKKRKEKKEKKALIVLSKNPGLTLKYHKVVPCYP